MGRIKSIIGQKYGKLTVLSYAGMCEKNKNSKWLCKCECGNEKLIRKTGLKAGTTKSCGCIVSPSSEIYEYLFKIRFLNYIKKTDNCWLWKGTKLNNGYGAISFKSKFQLAHRIAYRIFKGEFDDNLCVCHHCDNRICVNPDHLFLGTYLDNITDKENKKIGNQPKGEKNGRAKLNKKKADEIRNLFSQGVKTIDLSNLYGVHRVTINLILRGGRWA